jgi:MDMPI C-terminal domain
MPRLPYDRYDTELQAETARFAAAVHDADPAHPVPTCPAWTIAQLTEHVGLGHRRTAELAVGRPVTLAPDMAADGISDLLDLFSILPRIDDFPALAQLRGHGQTLHFHATDPSLAAAGEWLAHRAPSGVEWEHRHAAADATLRGPALDLLLVLSRRAALDTSRLETSGDPELLAHWLEHSRLEPA